MSKEINKGPIWIGAIAALAVVFTAVIVSQSTAASVHREDKRKAQIVATEVYIRGHCEEKFPGRSLHLCNGTIVDASQHYLLEGGKIFTKSTRIPVKTLSDGCTGFVYDPDVFPGQVSEEDGHACSVTISDS